MGIGSVRERVLWFDINSVEPEKINRVRLVAVNCRENRMKVAGAHSRIDIEVVAADWLLELCYRGEVLEGLTPYVEHDAC